MSAAMFAAVWAGSLAAMTALRLIRDEGLAVKEVGYRLGFSDPAALSRAFKRWTTKGGGLNPDS